MFIGLAGAVLVFAGIWHLTEWMMDGRRRDTWALVPFGVLYLLLGCLIALSIGGFVTQLVALISVCLGCGIAIQRRNQLALRKWVINTFIWIDVVIIVSLIAGWAL